ncbi:MAG: hypothetical protein PVG21_07850, partial [Gammaproteobacteria bacterium]
MFDAYSDRLAFAIRWDQPTTGPLLRLPGSGTQDNGVAIYCVCRIATLHCAAADGGAEFAEDKNETIERLGSRARFL